METLELNNCAANLLMDVEFEDLCFTVKTKHGVKEIVKGVTGKFKSGELTAIMGPSGAGKTSLLNVLTGFQTNGVRGTITCSCPNSNDPSKVLHRPKQYKKSSRYILQNDQLAPYFTVEEIMMSTAKLKKGTLPEKTLEFMINEILNTLSLTVAKQTRCNNLSGGQRKRLSVALELIDDPAIMFLDEPTTGLDICSSTQCIQMLKNIARQGRTIICTIHQPSAPLFGMFDHVYVMANGKCVYQGASDNTVPYLATLGLNCPQYHNPADYLIEVASGEFGEYIDALSKTATDKKWRNSISSDKELCTRTVYSDILNDTNSRIAVKNQPTECQRFQILLVRQLTYIYRDWSMSHLKLFLHILVGIFLGINFEHASDNGGKVMANLSLLMISIVYLSYTSLMPAALRFPSEIDIIKKEHFNNWYRLSTYYSAFLVADIPLQVLFSIAFTTTSYFVSNQPHELFRFIMVVLLQAMVTLVASSMGLVCGTLLNPINGTFIGAITTCVFLCFAGFLILFSHMSTIMYGTTYLSYMSFAMEGLAQATYGYNRTNLRCPDNVPYCLYKSPKKLLEDIGMSKPNYWLDIVYLSGTMILFRFIAFFTLKRRLKTN